MIPPKVSVIIPVFNNRTYLKRCVDSVTGQDYKNIELILVDDGSNDGSLEVCKKLKNDDQRIILHSQANSGVSSARNAGIDIATGKYVTFVDSDDWLEKDAIRNMVEMIIKKRVDCVRTHYIIDHENGRQSHPETGISQGMIVKNDLGLLMYQLLMARDNCFVMLLLIKKSILDDHRIRFSTKFSMMEDVAFYADLLSRIDSIYVSNKPTYHYSWNPDSASRSLNRLIDNARSTISVSNKVDNEVHKFLPYEFDLKSIHAVHLSLIASRLITATSSSSKLTFPKARKYVYSVHSIEGFKDLAINSNLNVLKWYQKYTTILLIKRWTFMFYVIIRFRSFVKKLANFQRKLHSLFISIYTKEAIK